MENDEPMARIRSRKILRRAGWVLLFLSLTGPLRAEQETPPATPPPPGPRVSMDLAPREDPEVAGQPPLATVRLQIGRASVEAEVAARPVERQQGLMHRRSLPEGRGMLFVFPEPQPMTFWMRNTLVPLSIAYISPTGIIMEIHDLKPMDETPVSSSMSFLQYALEVPQGWFAKNQILPGDRVVGLPDPSISARP